MDIIRKSVLVAPVVMFFSANPSSKHPTFFLDNYAYLVKANRVMSILYEQRQNQKKNNA